MGVVKNWCQRICARLIGWLGPAEPEHLASALEAWYQSPVGEQLLAQQRSQCEAQLRLHPGFRAMVLQLTAEQGLLTEGPQLHKFSLSNRCAKGSAAIADFDALPLPTGLIDVVLLHHVLDYCELPHEALKEAARVVAPSGHLVVFGFNPSSWMGLFKWPMRLTGGHFVWRCRMLSLWRMHDWLRLLGFQVETVHFGCFAPPFQSRRLLRLLCRARPAKGVAGLPFGNYYMIVARKQVAKTITSRTPTWLARGIAPVKLNESLGAGQRRQKPVSTHADSGHDCNSRHSQSKSEHLSRSEH